MNEQARHPELVISEIGTWDRLSGWFKGEPEIAGGRWSCPAEGCAGHMVANGFVWPTFDPGYHHTCDACGFTAAIHEHKYK